MYHNVPVCKSEDIIIYINIWCQFSIGCFASVADISNSAGCENAHTVQFRWLARNCDCHCIIVKKHKNVRYTFCLCLLSMFQMSVCIHKLRKFYSSFTALMTDIIHTCIHLVSFYKCASDILGHWGLVRHQAILAEVKCWSEIPVWWSIALLIFWQDVCNLKYG